jgi:hypothetical protein
VRLEGIAPASRLVGKQFLIVAILSRWSSPSFPRLTCTVTGQEKKTCGERGHASYPTWRKSVHTLWKKEKGQTHSSPKDEPRSNHWTELLTDPERRVLYMHFVCIIDTEPATSVLVC